MSLLPLLAALLVALPQQPQDTALFIPREDFLRLYTNCDEERWPYGTEERFVPKTAEEIRAGVARRTAAEPRWRAFFNQHVGDSITVTPDSQWVYPLAVRGRLLNNYSNPRPGGPHEALDIFVTREGATVRTPVAGVVVAAGDQWQGGWNRARRDLDYQGGGLSRRAGNGVVIFEPASDAYVYFAHLQPGILVRTGDLVRAGQPLGLVGHTGNAAGPGRGKHLHFAYKKAGSGCGIDSVLVSVNPYRLVRAARARMPASAAR